MGREDEELYQCYDLRNHPLAGENDRRWRMVNLLHPEKNPTVVVWETSRREVELPPVLLPDWDHSNREATVDAMEETLLDLPPFDDAQCQFWKWLSDEASDEEIKTVLADLRTAVPNGNSIVSSHNPIITFCTGSHNNVGVLGSMEQAKNATMCLIPYQSKVKFAISESLAVINDSLHHVRVTESKTVKDDKGTVDRSVKQLLARVLDQLHLMMELSDYQVAAALLEMPSLIGTDTHEYGNPGSLAALGGFLQLQEDKEAALDTMHKTIASKKEKGIRRGQQMIGQSEPDPDSDPDDWSLGSFIVPDESDSDESTEEAHFLEESGAVEELKFEKGSWKARNQDAFWDIQKIFALGPTGGPHACASKKSATQGSTS